MSTEGDRAERSCQKLVNGLAWTLESGLKALEQTHLTVDQGFFQWGPVSTIGGGRAVRGVVKGRHVDLSWIDLW